MQIESEYTFDRDIQIYYKHLFPYKQLFRWLSYDVDKPGRKNAASYIQRREFSFEVKFGSETFYMRYMSFESPQLMQKFLLKPDTIYQKYDIGAVFDIIPKKQQHMVPEEKEMVIDIDMTDYGDVRNCCQGATVCLKCWKFLRVAGEILNESLTEDFGYEHILWIYSGRRGIHLWICDKQVRSLNNYERKGIINYLTVNVSNESSGQLVKHMDKRPYHPRIKRSKDIVSKYFKDIIIHEQNSLINEAVLKKIENLFREQGVSVPIDRKAIYCTNSETLWEYLEEKLGDKAGKWSRFLDQIQVMCLYPRLDANVSTTINHLLKGPFSIHPSTGNVCVAFQYQDFAKFNPFDVPNLSTICAQIQEHLGRNADQKDADGLYQSLIDKTKLLPYIRKFEQFLDNYERKRQQAGVSI